MAEPNAHHRPLLPVLAFVAVAALAVRLSIALRGGGLGGTYGYDDGVYYSAASSLLSGRIPYRDFVLLHPPGVMLVLSPFAMLGRLTHDRVGFEAARAAWMFLGALNAVLVARISHRAGLAAAAAGGLFYAVWTPVARTETTIRLEPLVTLGLLIALTVLTSQGATTSRSRLLWVGAPLAVATSIKIWAIVPALLVLLWAWRRAGTKAVGWAVLGGLGAGVLVNGPFLATASTTMFRMVVLDQLGRGRSLVDTAARLAHILVPGAKVPDQWSPGPMTLAAAGLALVLVATACLGNAHGRFALSLLGAQVIVLLLSPSFFSYYSAFAGPGLALVVASVVAWLPAPARPGPTRGPARGLHGLVALALGLGLVVTLTSSLEADSRAVLSAAFPAAKLGRAASASRCVTSDSPDALILTDLFTRDLRRGCEVPVDLSGLTYDRDALPLRANGTSVPRSLNTRWQRDLGSYLATGQSIFVLRPLDDGVGGAALRHLQVLEILRRGRAFALLANGPHQRAPSRGSS